MSRSQFLFTGCYFAATGEDADRQAFIKSVFAKLIENQGELEWASDCSGDGDYVGKQYKPYSTRHFLIFIKKTQHNLQRIDNLPSSLANPIQSRERNDSD